MSASSIRLSSGVVSYNDSGGTGRPVVLLHGLMMDAELWSGVAALLEAAGHRCITPTLPLGAHRMPASRGFRFSFTSLADLVTEFLEKLDLADVTLVGADTGGAIAQVVVRRDPGRVTRLALVACESFDDYPARMTGTALTAGGKLPTAPFRAFLLQLRLRPIRRSPFAFGWLTRYGDATTARWIEPAIKHRALADDLRRALRGLRTSRSELEDASAHLADFAGPALVIWADQDRVMPSRNAHRLADLLPLGSLAWIPNSRSLIPLDQPDALAWELEGLLRR